MTLGEFWSMLLGAELHIHTNHKNILNIGDYSQRRLDGSLMSMNMVLNYITTLLRGLSKCCS